LSEETSQDDRQDKGVAQDLIQSSLEGLSSAQLIRLGELAELDFGEWCLLDHVEHEVHGEDGVLQRVCVLRIQIHILFGKLDDVRWQEGCQMWGREAGRMREAGRQGGREREARTSAVLVLEDESGLVAGESMWAAEATHDREVSDDISADSIEAIAKLSGPRAAAGAEGVSTVRAVDEPAHVPHLHTWNLVHREPRDRKTSEMQREGVGTSAIVRRSVDILEEDPVRGRQCGDGVLLQPATTTSRERQTQGGSDIRLSKRDTHLAPQKKSKASADLSKAPMYLR
jgi:hypothetical protein